MSLFTSGPNKESWNIMFGLADKAWKYHETEPDSYPITNLRDQWKDWIDSDSFQGWIDSDPVFERELRQYDPDLLYDLF
jgi:hypothetical protein